MYRDILSSKITRQLLKLSIFALSFSFFYCTYKHETRLYLTDYEILGWSNKYIITLFIGVAIYTAIFSKNTSTKCWSVLALLILIIDRAVYSFAVSSYTSWIQVCLHELVIAFGIYALYKYTSFLTYLILHGYRKVIKSYPKLRDRNFWPARVFMKAVNSLGEPTNLHIMLIFISKLYLVFLIFATLGLSLYSAMYSHNSLEDSLYLTMRSHGHPDLFTILLVIRDAFLLLFVATLCINHYIESTRRNESLHHAWMKEYDLMIKRSRHKTD